MKYIWKVTFGSCREEGARTHYFTKKRTAYVKASQYISTSEEDWIWDNPFEARSTYHYLTISLSILENGYA